MKPRIYIVELEDGVYLAPWEGNPGRTLKKYLAMEYLYKPSARNALKKARQFRRFENAKIERIK